mgnify:CR=1 FL=1
MIRAITQADRDLFFALSDEFYHSAAVLHPVPREYYARSWDELMRPNGYLECFIFEVDGAPAGYALIAKTYSPEAGGPAIWLEELFVRAQYRSQGLGRAFFEYMQKNRPAARYRLEVEPDNARARALYEQLGYRELPYMQMVRDRE